MNAAVATSLDSQFDVDDLGKLGAVVFDRAWTIHAWNATLEAWTGVPASRAIGARLTDLFPDAITPAIRTRIERAFDERAVVVLSAALHRRFLPIARPLGEPGEWMIQRTLVRPTDDGADKVLAIIEDVSVAHLQLEELRCERSQLQRLYVDLAEVHGRLEQRTIELSMKNEQLAEARRKAETATLAKSAFLAHMSHELRTPLTAIMGFADVVLDDDPSTEHRASIETIRRNGEHLLQIINDILDLSKIEAGMLELHVEPWRPAELANEVVRLLSVRAETKGVGLRCAIDPGVPPELRGDPLRVRQILINLIGNAIKFTSHGEVRLEVRYVEGRKPRLRFDVVDTGAGIAAHDIDRLFQPFTQVTRPNERKEAGAGLGLAISQRLAKKMGGSIRVKSVVGRGSRFRVSLPTAGQVRRPTVESYEAAAGRAAGELTSVKAKPPAPLVGMRILVAEDGPDNQRLIRFVLTKAGAEVRIVEHGQDAVDAALAAQRSGVPFDVIVMDMQMPVMTGYEATRMLRAKGYRRPIVALTANAMSGDRELCLEAGCDEYLSKPIDRPKLLLELAKRRQ